MAKPKDDDIKGWLNRAFEQAEQRKINNPVIDERWWVADYYPQVQHWNDDEPRPARAVACSSYFTSLEDAEAFVEKHNPEPGAELRIYHQNKRRITTEEWVNW